MDRSKVAVGLVKSVYWTVRIFGLCPVHRDSRTKAFKTTTLELIYSMVIWWSFTSFYLTSGILSLIQLTPLLFTIYTVVVLTTIGIIFLNHCIHANDIAKFVTDAIDVFRELNRCHNMIESIPLWRLIALLIIKVVFVGGIVFMTTTKFCIRFSIELNGYVSYRSCVASVLATFFRTTISHIYFGFILIASLYFTIVNNDIERAMRRSKYVMNHMHTDVEVERLLRRLNQIATSLRRLSELIRRFNDIFSCEILFMYGELVASPLIEVFVYYNQIIERHRTQLRFIQDYAFFFQFMYCRCFFCISESAMPI